MNQMKRKLKFILILFELMNGVEVEWWTAPFIKKIKIFFNYGIVGYEFGPQFTPFNSPSSIPSAIHQQPPLQLFFFSSLIKLNEQAARRGKRWKLLKRSWCAVEGPPAHNPQQFKEKGRQAARLLSTREKKPTNQLLFSFFIEFKEKRNWVGGMKDNSREPPIALQKREEENATAP